jgi:hypothetical protein
VTTVSWQDRELSVGQLAARAGVAVSALHFYEARAAWRSELDDRIARLTQLRDDFTDCIGCGCLSLERCRLANPRDAYGERGPGPQRLGLSG